MNLYGLSDLVLVGLISAGAVLTTALITFGGIVLNNYITVRNLRKQHGHDANQKTEDRKAAIRREVYPKVIEHIHALHTFFGELHSLPLNASSEAFTNMLESIGKLWVIAEYETTVLSRQYVNVVGESYVFLLATSIPYRQKAERLLQATENLEEAKAEFHRASVALSQAEYRKAPAEVMEPLSREALRLQLVVREKRVIHMQFSDQAGPARMEFMRLVLAEIEKSNDVFVKLICALRREIGLMSSPAEFMLLVQDQQTRSKQAFETNFSELIGVAPRAAASVPHQG